MNNKGAGQTARMCRLICALVVPNGINSFSHDVAPLVKVSSEALLVCVMFYGQVNTR